MTARDLDSRKVQRVPTPEWLSSCVATLLENHLDDMPRTLIIRAPGDPLSIYVLQPGGEHYLVQVNRAEMVIS